MFLTGSPEETQTVAAPTSKAMALPSRRELFALAAVLVATVLTAAAAIAGLNRKAAPLQPSPPTVSQIVGPAPAAPPRVEPGD
jgi:hypothetical protein